MIVRDEEIKQYLIDYHKGKITPGYGIGCKLDDFIRFKPSTFNMVLGHDNTGKTYFKTWYYLNLSIKYGFTWAIWTGENKAGQIVRNLIQQYLGENFKSASLNDIEDARKVIKGWFTFIDNSKTYKFNELLKIFESVKSTGCLIDPYTGLDRKYGHSDNYDFLNQARQWVNSTGITLDVCTHPVSAAGRGQALYPKGHTWEGHIRNPFKSEAEGGKPFANRCDDFIVIHRILDSPGMRSYTLVYVEKIKDIETGGALTDKDEPILCEWNRGLGFTVEGTNPLKNDYVAPVEDYQQKPLKPAKDFDNEKQNELNL